jgi:hypothetical protein
MFVSLAFDAEICPRTASEHEFALRNQRKSGALHGQHGATALDIAIPGSIHYGMAFPSHAAAATTANTDNTPCNIFF